MHGHCQPARIWVCARREGRDGIFSPQTFQHPQPAFGAIRRPRCRAEDLCFP